MHFSYHRERWEAGFVRFRFINSKSPKNGEGEEWSKDFVELLCSEINRDMEFDIEIDSISTVMIHLISNFPKDPESLLPFVLNETQYYHIFCFRKETMDILVKSINLDVPKPTVSRRFFNSDYFQSFRPTNFFHLLVLMYLGPTLNRKKIPFEDLLRLTPRERERVKTVYNQFYYLLKARFPAALESFLPDFTRLLPLVYPPVKFGHNFITLGMGLIKVLVDNFKEEHILLFYQDHPYLVPRRKISSDEIRILQSISEIENLKKIYFFLDHELVLSLPETYTSQDFYYCYCGKWEKYRLGSIQQIPLGLECTIYCIPDPQDFASLLTNKRKQPDLPIPSEQPKPKTKTLITSSQITENT